MYHKSKKQFKKKKKTRQEFDDTQYEWEDTRDDATNVLIVSYLGI